VIHFFEVEGPVANLTVSMFRRVNKKYYPVVFNKNGSIKPGVVKVKGVETKLDGGNFYLSYQRGSKCIRESVGPDATHAIAQRDNRVKKLRAIADGSVAGFTVSTDSKEPEGKTLEAAKSDYLDKISRRRSLSTFQNYSIALRLFLESCTKKMLRDVTPEDLHEFADFLRNKGHNKRTVFNRFSNVHTFLSKQGHILEIESEDFPKYVNEEPVAYTDSELKKLFSVCDPQERLLYRFAWMTGFRLGELQHAEWKDIDTANSTVTVRSKLQYNWEPKAQKGRTVPIPDVLLAELLEAKKSAASTLIFPSANGKVEGHMLRRLKATAKRGGLNPADAWLHKFRSSFITGHINNGIPLPTVSRWAGHENLSTTQRYAASISAVTVKDKLNSTFANI
jgi:integrase